MKERFQDKLWIEMCVMHALSDDWQAMDFQDFLAKRRLLIAGVIKKGFDALL